MTNILKIVAESKVCTKCKERKALTAFSKRTKAKDGHKPRCKVCTNKAYKVTRPSGVDGRKHVILTDGGRKCLICKEAKTWDEFAKDVRGFNQKTATCKPCRNRKSQELYPDQRGGTLKSRPDRVKRLYGVTYEHVVQTLSDQFGRCANIGCSKEISLEVHGVQSGRAVIDHDHTTGAFRAVLCVDCNCLLGQLETKSEKVLGLMSYMNKHKKAD